MGYGDGYNASISQETAHGDAWVARIRAQHDAMGEACPCGNGERTDTVGIIDEARARADARPTPPPIDYARMQKVFPRQKAALTRARKSGDPERVAAVCRDAVRVWDDIGAWPDDWRLFQRTLDDMLPWHASVDIRDL